MARTPYKNPEDEKMYQDLVSTDNHMDNDQYGGGNRSRGIDPENDADYRSQDNRAQAWRNKRIQDRNRR